MSLFLPDRSDSLTVSSVVLSYLWHERRRLSRSSLHARKGFLLALCRELGRKRVIDCRAIHLTNWIDSHREWQSEWTRHSVVKYVQTAFNWACEKAEIIDRNPFRKVSLPPGMSRRDVTPDEFQRMLRGTAGRRVRYRPSPGARIREMLIFLRLTGCRPGEAASLKWQHVDFERQCVILPQHKTAKSQKQPLPRVIHLHPVAIRLLERIRKRCEGERVFLTYRRTPWTRHTLAQRVKRARVKAGVPHDAKLYGVRHAFGTRAIINGCDIKTLATLMGHTTTKMTEKYIHLAGKIAHLASALDLINRRK